jgi:adenylate cyclase
MPLRRGLRVVALAGLVAAIGAAVSYSQAGFSLEEETGLQWLFRLRGPRPAPPEAVVVRFDRDALARFSSLPADPSAWPKPLAECVARHGPIAGLAEATRLERLPRAIPACLVEQLTARGAAVVAFDVSFRRDPNREDGVPAFAGAVRDHGRVILLDLGVRQLGPMVPAQAGAGAGVQADWLEKPHPMLAAAAIATASMTLPRGSSQIHQFWSFNPALPSPTQLPMRALEVLALPALAQLARNTQEPLAAALPPAELLARYTGWFRAQVAATEGGVSPTELAQLSVADAAALRALTRAYRGPSEHYLNFYGVSGTFPSISVADLLVPEADGARTSPIPDLRGRVVFVGLQELASPQAADSFPTAFRSAEGVDLAGVEIAATAFSNLLYDEALRALPEWVRLLLVAALGFTFTLASCVGMVWRGLALTLALAAAYAAVAVASFILGNLWLPVAIPLFGLLPMAVALGQLVHYLGAARWLGVYAPRQVSRQLLRGRDFAAGSAQMREVSVMLTDIVGFTTLAEQSAPAAVAEFVNRHFTMLTRCVEGEGGTVAQFIGDSVMSFWGAPDPQPDHAARACRCALAIGRALEVENEWRAAEGLAPVRMRIGINTGPVTAGNVGAPGRSNYGIVGDTVNTTQRIEQLGKTLCQDRPTVAVLVSARTMAQAGPGFGFSEAGAHELRGRRELVMIYRLDMVESAAAAPPVAGAQVLGPQPMSGGG